MKAKPSRWGVGPAIGAAAIAWAGPATVLHVLYYPRFAIPGWARPASLLLGGLLVAAGAVWYGWALRAFSAARRKGVLATSGPYARSRHPLYASWVYLISPGMVLWVGSWLWWPVPVVTWAAARWLVRREERDLEARFGEAYRLCRRRTWPLFPKVW